MSTRPTFRAMLWRWRRLLTAVFVALCLAFVIASFNSSGRITPVELMVADGDFDAGHELSESDVRYVQAPAGTIPEELVPEDIAGHRLSIAINAGTPLTSSMLVGPTLSESAPDGTIVIPVYLSTPPELTPVGSTVDLWAPDEGNSAYIAATAATIMAFTDAEVSGSVGGDTTDITYTYVAVPADDATFILGLSAGSPLMAVLHN